jgi:hypothetical protein
MKKGIWVFRTLLLCLLLTGMFIPGGQSAQAGAGGPHNPGLEKGTLDGSPIDWNISPAPGGAVIVVNSENATEFPTYASMENASVNPYRGNLMLRLGIPKGPSQNQKPGENLAYQRFTPDCTTLQFSFRVFSWEFRGGDTFRFDLSESGTNGARVGTLEQLIITMPDSSTIDLAESSPAKGGWGFTTVGKAKNGAWLDTGWQKATITIPQEYVGVPLTLTYAVGGASSGSHPIWAYFDNVNTPPVAQFDLLPGAQTRYEGTVVDFHDTSYDPDPGDSVVAWNWKVGWGELDSSGNYAETATSNLKNPYFIPPNDGNYTVTLTVSDSYGATDSKSVTMGVVNAPPIVNALNVEVLTGGTANLVGRFLDPGWQDTHNATWSVGTLTSLREDNLAFMDSGIVTGDLASVSASLTGTLTVTDDSGAATSDNFSITVVNDDPLRDEPNDNVTEATPLNSDSVHLSYIQSASDIDVFEIRNPDGSALTAGSEVLVTLKNLPADYDLILLIQRLADKWDAGGWNMGGWNMGGWNMGGWNMGGWNMGGWNMGGWNMGGWNMGGWNMGGWNMGGWNMGGWNMGGWNMGGWNMGGWNMGGWNIGGWNMGGWNMGGWNMGDFTEFPLSRMSYNGLQVLNDNIGGTDISLEELGLSLEQLGGDGDIAVAGFSANRGLSDEVALARADVDGTRIFAVVVANGAYSTSPYSLQVETSSPLDIATWLASQNIIYSPPVSNWADNTTAIIHTYNLTPKKTLFVTQRERIVGRYGSANWTALSDNLTALADHPAIAGDIISVPISIYDAWDHDYSNISAANQVTLGIRNAIMEYLTANPDIQYVVLVGSDDIIPFHRTPDETGIGNERDYLANSFLKPGSPLFFSLLQGYMLTDDYYVDSFPMPWQGRALYVPDKAVSRLVETPANIEDIAQAFLASDGKLNANTALVTGYDFFDDGAGAVKDILVSANIATDDSLRSPTAWTADELRTKFLTVRHDIANINAHYTHYLALSASGFVSGNFSDVLTSTQVSSATANLLDSIIFTIGCHSGLNVPDASAFSAADVGSSVDPRLDFPQSMHQAIFLASTGFGYGDDEGIGGTERLMGLFLDEALRNANGDSLADVTVGQALKAAKQGYITGLSTITAYDEKSSTEFTLYGLPQYQVELPATTSSLSVQAAAPTGGDTFNLTIIDGATSTTTVYPLTPVNTTSGSYYTADGDAQATPGRPIQPRVVINLPGGDPVHGALVVSGTYREIPGFDPVITRPTDEWEVGAAEQQVDLQAYWPSELATVNSLETGGNVTQTLVIVPGQFRADRAISGNVTGTQRLFTALTIRLLRSPLTPPAPEDFNPPTLTQMDLQAAGATSANVTVSASDPSGIKMLSVLSFANGTVTATTNYVTGSPLPTSASLTITVPFSGNERLVVYVGDAKGNIASYTGKGASLRLIRVDAGPDQGFVPGVPGVPGVPVNFTTTLSNFTDLAAPVFYTWNFADGTSASGQVTGSSFTVSHAYSGDPRQAIAKLRVTDSDGGIGVDTVRVTIKTIPAISMASSVNPSIVGQPVTFAANVSANTSLFWPIWLPTPVGGNVTFTDNLSSWNMTVPIVQLGEGVAQASVTTTALPPGWHVISASYSGDTFFYPGSGNLTQEVYYNFAWQSPIAGSQYEVGRTIPVKFTITDFNGVPTFDPVAEVWVTDTSAVTQYKGTADPTGGYYHTNIETDDLLAGNLTISISLDGWFLSNTSVTIILK